MNETRIPGQDQADRAGPAETQGRRPETTSGSWLTAVGA
jgi:hypothetical protein